MYTHEIYESEHKNSLKQIARYCRLEKTKPKKQKAAKGGLRCLWGKKVFNKYILYILAHITALGSLTKKDAPFAPFYT